MTYTVSSGTLNSTIPYHTIILPEHVIHIHISNRKFLSSRGKKSLSSLPSNPTVVRQEFVGEIYIDLMSSFFKMLIVYQKLLKWRVAKGGVLFETQCMAMYEIIVVRSDQIVV